MYVALHIAGATADRAGVIVLRRRIEVGLVDYPFRLLGRDLSLSGDDCQTVGEVRVRVGRHEWILRAVRSAVVDRAAPVVTTAVDRQCVTRAAGHALSAPVAEVRFVHRRRIKFEVAQYKAAAHKRSELVAEQRAVQPALSEPALTAVSSKSSSVSELILCQTRL